MPSKSIHKMPVVILCGGMGTRLGEETETKPKPMVEIGGKPILWHLMRYYSSFGFSDFILCLGYKGELIREYFRHAMPEGWRVDFVDTGEKAMTGARVKRIESFVKTEHFMLTYGDGLSNVDLKALASFHFDHGRIATVTGVRPPARFGELVVDSKSGVTEVVRFTEKPDGTQSTLSGFINGGFFVFSRKLFAYLGEDDACVLERAPMERLVTDKQLMMFPHTGFWQCMDTRRDVELLRELWDSGRAPWRAA